METLEEKIKRVLKDKVQLVAYNPIWPVLFEREKQHLLACLPGELINRIEHFGSTAVPDLSAKPIIDILVEVTSLEETKKGLPLSWNHKDMIIFGDPPGEMIFLPSTPGSSNETQGEIAPIIFIWWNTILNTGRDYYSVII